MPPTLGDSEQLPRITLDRAILLTQQTEEELCIAIFQHTFIWWDNGELKEKYVEGGRAMALQQTANAGFYLPHYTHWQLQQSSYVYLLGEGEIMLVLQNRN